MFLLGRERKIMKKEAMINLNSGFDTQSWHGNCYMLRVRKIFDKGMIAC